MTMSVPMWPGITTAALAAVATWAVGGVAGWAALPAYLLFAWLTVGLVWIDLDVHRLPVGLVVPTGVAIVGILAVASLADGGTRWTPSDHAPGTAPMLSSCSW